jgi:hypothetical protein
MHLAMRGNELTRPLVPFRRIVRTGLPFRERPEDKCSSIPGLPRNPERCRSGHGLERVTGDVLTPYLAQRVANLAHSRSSP